MPSRKAVCVCGKAFIPRFGGQQGHLKCVKSSSAPLRKHLVIPDTQVKPGVNTDHLEWIGRYAAEKKPDLIVHLGDHADMPSLSSYDKGKKSFEGRRYKADVAASKTGMERLMRPIQLAKLTGWDPDMWIMEGNHEHRICRAVESQPELEGVISLDDLQYEQFGWKVFPFLEIAEADGVAYSHFFTSGPMGRPCSSAAVMLRERMGSAIAGHVQKFDMAVHPKTGHIAIMAGIAYTHTEDYLGPQGNSCRQQIVMLHEVSNGRFDPMFVSLDYLRRRFA